MKVKEKLLDGRGRPRKFQPGEAVEWRLRAPDNLLMELRICARAGNRSVNDEIIARLLLSLNYQPGKAVIKTAEGERLIALAVKFEEWLGNLLDGESVGVVDDVKVPPKQEQLWVWREGERILLPGKTTGYSMRIPENLADEIRAMAKVHNRSLNDEMLTRLMNTLGYFTERLLDQNEDAQALKVLCMEFEVFLKEKIREVEKSDLPWDEKPSQ
ncbi:TPA: Arc family DNA-binding protein [Enterobacter cloacae]|uniref:Arc family DNA-binding protein n=1 Tax=Enterobacter TaxID=547 RepID=UPI0015B4A282|nr:MULTISPECIES: Arc family DNA-binding protein [Enterobacter]HAS0831066.1 Arc family DNA-binding protein [Enterobacter cloacae subsp. cloacae]NWJ80399.1 Arc family DNA-binding protein [Enterobacter sp. SECR19-1250]QUG52249.1 Arc family DNA-binding protein [Enterobacter cloacae]HDS4825219.1 Arc family DNA-binding protein [Enterobacter cloacae]HDT2261411.1 Arc family DNA-binding protein [Enterobacter cloacae]